MIPRIGISHARHRTGFTLLEVLLAVVLTMLIVGAVMNMVSAGVAGGAWIEREEDRLRSAEAVLDYLENSMMETVGKEGLAIWSVEGAEGEGWRDQLGWTSPDGDAAFQQALAVPCEIIAGIRNEPAGPVLGIVSRPEVDLNGDYKWIPLLSGVDAFNLEFFDSRLNAYVSQWPRGNPTPAVVRMTLRFAEDGLVRTRLVRLPELQAVGTGRGGGDSAGSSTPPSAPATPGGGSPTPGQPRPSPAPSSPRPIR